MAWSAFCIICRDDHLASLSFVNPSDRSRIVPEGQPRNVSDWFIKLSQSIFGERQDNRSRLAANMASNLVQARPNRSQIKKGTGPLDNYRCSVCFNQQNQSVVTIFVNCFVARSSLTSNTRWKCCRQYEQAGARFMALASLMRANAAGCTNRL